MINVEVDTETASRWLRGLYSSQIPYALMRAINKTALQVQVAERRDMDQEFSLRRKDWAHRNVKIRRDDFATKTKLQAIVRIEAPGDRSRSDILAKFEETTTKKPKGSHIAIPVDVRTTTVGIVRKNQRPRSFDFVHWGGNVWRGKDRTFMIRNPDGSGGIYQRTGRRGRKKKDGTRGHGAGRRMASSVSSHQDRDLNVRVLYRFTPLARIEKRLKFEDTARRVIVQVFDDNFAEAFRRAVETAR